MPVMRPLTVMQLIPALSAGGAERSTLEIGQALVRAGHRSLVVSAGGKLVSELESGGSRHIKLDLGQKTPWTLRHLPKLRQLIRVYKPDILHARSRMPAWMAWLAIKGLGPGRPHFVTTVHGLNSPGFYSGVMLRGERVICVSDTVCRYVQKHYAGVHPNRLRVVPRGVDMQEFPHGHAPDKAVRERLDIEYPQLAGRELITLPARGTRLKGHHTALKLMAELKHGAKLDCALLLLGVREAGREHYVEELQQWALRLDVADRIAFMPSRRDVRDMLAMSRVVLQLSRQPEAFGRTVVEALSLGVPVVGYAHGGVGELLHELYPEGAVPLEDTEELARRVAALLRAPRRLLPPLSRYRVQDMQRTTLALYEELVGTGSVQGDAVRA